MQVFVAGSNGTYIAESFTTAGTRIQFCGHGALAAAFAVLNEVEPDAESVQFSNADREWQSRRSDDSVTLIYKCPKVRSIEVPPVCCRGIGCSADRRREPVGTDTDYLICELSDAETVQSMQPDFAALTAATQAVP